MPITFNGTEYRAGPQTTRASIPKSWEFMPSPTSVTFQGEPAGVYRQPVTEELYVVTKNINKQGTAFHFRLLKTEAEILKNWI